MWWPLSKDNKAKKNYYSIMVNDSTNAWCQSLAITHEYDNVTKIAIGSNFLT